MTRQSNIRPSHKPDRQAPQQQPTGTVSKWEAFNLLKDLTSHFGLNSSDLLVLEKHLAVVPDVDKQGSVRVSFQSQTALCRAANGMTERTARRCEAKLEALGFLSRKFSGNGRRYPDRHAKTGKIVTGYGIDLQPFFERIPEILEAHQAQAIAQRERASALSQVSSALSELKRLVGTSIPEVFDLARAYHNIRRRVSSSLAEIGALFEEVKRLYKGVNRQACLPFTDEERSPQQVSEVPVQKSTSDAPTACRPAYGVDSRKSTVIHQPSDTGNVSADTGQNVRRKESKNTKDLKKASSELSAAEAWSRCPNLAEFFLNAPRDEMDAKRIAYEACGFFGLRKEAVASALAGFGIGNLLLVLDYLTPKAAELTNPTAYLASMLRKFEAGEAVAGGRVRPGRVQRRPETTRFRKGWGMAQ